MPKYSHPFARLSLRTCDDTVEKSGSFERGSHILIELPFSILTGRVLECGEGRNSASIEESVVGMLDRGW